MWGGGTQPRRGWIIFKIIQSRVRPNHHVLVWHCTLLHSPFDEFPLISIQSKPVIESGTNRHRVGERCRRKAILFSVHYAVFTEPDILKNPLKYISNLANVNIKTVKT